MITEREIIEHIEELIRHNNFVNDLQWEERREQNNRLEKALKILKNNDEQQKYKKGFNILMEYWDSLPDEEKNNINKRLQEVGI